MNFVSRWLVRLLVGTLLCAWAGRGSAQRGARVNDPLARETVGDVTHYEISPDSTHVVYRADQEVDEVFRLYGVPIGAGPVVALGPNPAPGGDVQDFQVSPDSRVVVYRADQEADEVFELYASALDGKMPGVKLNGALAGGGDVLRFALSARGRVVYLADQEADERFELFSVPLVGGVPERLNGPLVAGGDVEDFLVSPDGMRVVFTADASMDGVLELFQVESAGGTPVRLSPTLRAGPSNFRVSPDSKNVLYNTSSRLERVSILGGPPTELWPAPAGFWISPDSRCVVVSTFQALFSVPLLGGPALQLTPDGAPRPLAVQISPDSKRVAYNLDGGDSVYGLYTVSIDGGPLVALDDGALGAENAFLFTPDSKNLVYTLLVSQATGGAVTYLAPSAGGAVRRLTNRDLLGGEVTPDSKRAVCVEEYRDNLFNVPLDGGAEIQLNEPAVVGGGVRAVRLSPDGARVVYLADQDEDRVFDLFSVAVSGGPIARLNGALVLGATGGDVQDAVFSPDGRYVVYRADQDTDEVFELYGAPLAGGPPVKLNAPFVRNGDVGTFSVRISPDSQWVVYSADQEVAGIRQIYGVPIEGGAARALNARGVGAGVYQFEISPDSRRVVYLNDLDQPNLPRLFSAPIEGGPSVPLAAELDGFQVNFQITPDSNAVVFAHDRTTDTIFQELFAVPLSGGPAVQLHPTPVANGGAGGLFQILPDSSAVVFVADLEVDNTLELYRSALDGSATTKLSAAIAPGGDVNLFAISPDGAHVAYMGDQEHLEVRELFSLSFRGLVRTKLSPPLVAGGDVRQFAISPDSTRAVFLADQRLDEVLELFSVPLAGGPATRLNPPPVTGGDVSTVPFRVSPDSARVVYLADLAQNDVFELFSVPLIGGASTKLNGTLPPGGDVLEGSDGFAISADSRRVVFLAEQRANEVLELFSAPLAGGVAPIRLNAPLAPGANVGVEARFAGYFPPFLLSRETVLYHADQDQDEVVELYLSPLSPRHSAQGPPR